MGARVALQDGRIAYAIDVDTLSRRGDAPAIRQEAEKVTGQDGKAYFRVDQESCCGSVLKIVAVAFLILLSGGILGVVLCFSSRASEYFLGHQIQVVDQAAYDLKFPLQAPPRNEGEPETSLEQHVKKHALVIEMGLGGDHAGNQVLALKKGDLSALTPAQINNLEQMKRILSIGNKAEIMSQLVLRWIRRQECGCLVDLCVEDPKLLREAVEIILARTPLEEDSNELIQIRLLARAVFERKIEACALGGDPLQTFRAQQQQVDAAFNAMFELGDPFDPGKEYPLLRVMFFDAELIVDWVTRFGVQVLAYVPTERLIANNNRNLNLNISFSLKGSEPAQEQVDVANAAFERAGYSDKQRMTLFHWQVGQPSIQEEEALRSTELRDSHELF